MRNTRVVVRATAADRKQIKAGQSVRRTTPVPNTVAVTMHRATVIVKMLVHEIRVVPIVSIFAQKKNVAAPLLRALLGYLQTNS